MLRMFRNFPLLSEDDGLGIPNGGEISGETLEVADPDNEGSVEKLDVADPTENEVLDSDDEEEEDFSDDDYEDSEDEEELDKSDRAFAEMRRQNKELEEALGLFFEGDNKIAQAKAYAQGIPVEEVIAEMESRQQAKTLQTENETLKEKLQRLEYERLKNQDLAEIKEAFPDADIKDVEELGELFFKYRSVDLSAKEAYELIEAKQGKPPKAIGKVKSSAPEREFFTRDEVMAMSSDERRRNIDKVRKSMQSW